MDPLSLDDAVSRYMDQPVLCSSGPGAQVFEAYDAEFGYELYQGPPQLWAMCAISSVEVRSVCDGMQPFYRFADLSRARPVNCSRNVSNPLNNFGRQHSPPGPWFRLPPYRQMYEWQTKGTTAYVFNKPGIPFMPARPSGAINSWKVPALLRLFSLLHQRYDHVIYHRAGMSDSLPERLTVLENDTADIVAIRKQHPRVMFLHELVRRRHREDVSAHAQRMNVAQLLLSLNAKVTVGTQGGMAVLASQVAQHFVFLCRAGQECGRDVHWWRKYNKNSRIFAAKDEERALNYFNMTHENFNMSVSFDAVRMRPARRPRRPDRPSASGYTTAEGRSVGAADCEPGRFGLACNHSVRSVFHEHEPYGNTSDLPLDSAKLTGWSPPCSFYEHIVRKHRTQFLVEVGVWKGMSAKCLASELKRQEHGVLIAVDTWLGALEFWTRGASRGKIDPTRNLYFHHGYPGVYYHFLANVVLAGLQQYVIPFPVPSRLAYDFLNQLGGAQPDLVHIDAAHEYTDAVEDIRLWWSLLRPGGVLLGDDFAPGGWDGVVRASCEHVARLGLEIYRPMQAGYVRKKWWVIKPNITTPRATAPHGLAWLDACTAKTPGGWVSKGDAGKYDMVVRVPVRGR